MPRRIRRTRYEAPIPSLKNLVLSSDRAYFSLGRLVAAHSLDNISQALPEGEAGFRRRAEPRLMHVPPTNARANLRDTTGEGAQSVERRFLAHPGVDATSVVAAIQFFVVGLKFHAHRNQQPLEISTQLVIEDRETRVYPSGYLLLGERILANEFAGIKSRPTEKLEASAYVKPRFNVNVGSFISDDFPLAGTGEVIWSPGLPDKITLQPIQALPA